MNQNNFPSNSRFLHTHRNCISTVKALSPQEKNCKFVIKFRFGSYTQKNKQISYQKYVNFLQNGKTWYFFVKLYKK